MYRTLIGWILAAWLLPVLAWAQGFGPTGGINVLPNDPTTGTILWRLAKITGAGTLVVAGPGDTNVRLYVITAGAGTTGSSTYQESGDTICEMDAVSSNKAGTHIVVGAGTGVDTGRCHQQDSPPANGYSVGTLLATSTTVGGTARVSIGNAPFIPGTGGGNVTSVGLAMPPEFTVTGTPVTGSGVLTAAKATQTANQIYAGPVSGGAAAPAFRGLVPADITAAGGTGSCAGDLAGTYPNCTVKQSSTAFALNGTDTQTLSGDVNDYALCTKVACRLNGGAVDRNITGFVARTVDGDLLDLCNVGTTNALVLRNDNGTASSAANRLLLSDDVNVAPAQCHLLRYDLTTARYRSVVNTGPSYRDIRQFTVPFGDPGASSPPLQDDNDAPDVFSNDYGRDLKILSVLCKAPLGTPSIDVVWAETNTSILASTCTCDAGATAWKACPLSATAANLIVHSFSGNGTACTTAPCGLTFRLVTAGGTAKYAVVRGKALLQ